MPVPGGLFGSAGVEPSSRIGPSYEEGRRFGLTLLAIYVGFVIAMFAILIMKTLEAQ